MAKASKPKKEVKKAPTEEPSQPVDFSAAIRSALNTKPVKWPKRDFDYI